MSKYLSIVLMAVGLSACAASPQYTEAKQQYAVAGKVSNGWPHKNKSGEPVKGPYCRDGITAGDNYTWPNSSVCK